MSIISNKYITFFKNYIKILLNIYFFFYAKDLKFNSGVVYEI